MSSPEPYVEAERILIICNACRYCDGHCSVFPAMEKRLTFDKADIDYLANLCHHCGSCFHHCQYAPPHEFDVNVPAVFQEIREQNVAQYIWPSFARAALSRNLLWTVAVFVVLCIAFVTAALSASGTAKFFSPHEGGFYEIIGHQTMVALFGGAGLLAAASLSVAA
ncbi:MAG: tricarballylate utilization protein TcuB, partial [Pseudomonadales bacterium]|nr:tricarballylate utilization protein TcuB [Pseudomonadales bacterium]